MPFITQGKTNYLYVLFVAALAIIASSFILGHYYFWIIEIEARLVELESQLSTIKTPDFMCGKEITITGHVGWRDYSKIVPEAKYYICSDDLASLGIQAHYPQPPTSVQIHCVPLDTHQEFLIDSSKSIADGPEVTINGTVQCIDNREEKEPNCGLSSIGCQLIMWLKESIPEDETADWKTYRNEEYGFEVKYPSDWMIREEIPEKGWAGISLTGINDSITSQVGIGTRTAYDEGLGREATLDEIATFLKDDAFVGAGVKNIKEKQIMLDDVPAIEFFGISLGKSEVNAILAIKDNNFFLVTCYAVKGCQSISAQILSTFKFIETFCGWSTEGSCNLDTDCQTGGCSGQVCQSKNEEPIETTCEWKDCYDEKQFGLNCKCVENKCQWSK